MVADNPKVINIYPFRYILIAICFEDEFDGKAAAINKRGGYINNFFGPIFVGYFLSGAVPDGGPGKAVVAGHNFGRIALHYFKPTIVGQLQVGVAADVNSRAQCLVAGIGFIHALVGTLSAKVGSEAVYAAISKGWNGVPTHDYGVPFELARQRPAVGDFEVVLK